MNDLASALETAYRVNLPARYRAFFEAREHEKHPRIVFDGYVRGTYALDFTTPRLADVNELGMEAGITDIEDADWAGAFAGCVPLAALSHPEVDEPKMFLALGAKDPAGPVYLFSQEGFSLVMLAESFDAFLSKLPNATVDLAKAHDSARAPAAPVEGRYDEPPHLERWNAYLEKGRAGDYVGALTELETLHSALPRETRVLRAMAHVLRDMSDFPRAFATIERAIAIDPSEENQLGLVGVQLAAGDPRAALATLQRANVAAMDDGDRAQHLARLAVCTHLAGDTTDALDLMKQAFAIERVSFFAEPWKSVTKQLKKQLAE